jgi:hypothetical protein
MIACLYNVKCVYPQKVLFVKILSLFVSLSFAQFHRATTLRTPRELPATAQTEKVLFINIPCLYTLRLTLYTLRPTLYTLRLTLYTLNGMRP